MGLREKRVHAVRLVIEGDRVGPGPGRHRLEFPPSVDIDHIDGPRISDGNVETCQRLAQEHHVRGATQVEYSEDLSGRRMDRDELALVACAKQALTEEVQLEAVGTARGQ